MKLKAVFTAALILLINAWLICPLFSQNRFATSDNLSGYVHWIDLYDASNNRIDPSSEKPAPYSPAKTCGRCHEYDTISHGWHFNATDPDALHGRPGQPWIWSDHRTGTHLPLSYRGWQGTLNPDDLGLSRWQVAAKLGGFMPGGGVGSPRSLAVEAKPVAGAEDFEIEDRKNVTGELPVDCMLCHRNQGSGYSPFTWTEQIEVENFAYAPSAALGIATISKNMSRIKDDFDPTDPESASKLPTVAYEAGKFRSDGKIFFDLVRKPKSEACYYCHTNLNAESVQGQRWLHDEDVHLRAGLSCADCHRNSLDHNTVRGFEDESHVAGSMVAALSCQGCHIGDGQETPEEFAKAGRFGAPKPAHKGLPPLHFDKLTCTACHSGPSPTAQVGRQVNSMAHHLGSHIKRTGEEFPHIVGTINIPINYLMSGEPIEEATPAEDVANSPELESSGTTNAVAETEEQYALPELAASEETAPFSEEFSSLSSTIFAEPEGGGKYAPHRMMWPSFWGTITDGKVNVLNPELAYDLVRRPLRVKKDFTEELAKVRLSSKQKKEILGDERGSKRDTEWTAEEKEKVAAAEAEQRKLQVNERVAAALEAIEEAYAGSQAVFVSGGAGFVRNGEAIETVDSSVLGEAASPYRWPVAHNVRPARQSLGATGCLECHSDESLFFNAEVTPVGLLPDQETTAIKVSELQGADMARLSTWSQLFAGRSSFKVAGLAALGLTMLVTLCAIAVNVGAFWRR